MTNNINVSIKIKFEIGIAPKIPTLPKMRIMLTMLEPTTLPRESPCQFFFAATIDVASFGKLAPIATIVKPIIKDGTLGFFATALAPITKKSAQ